MVGNQPPCGGTKSDQRETTRISTALPIQLVTSNGLIEGWTRDLSFDGVGVELNGVSMPTSTLTGSIQVSFEPGRVQIRVPALLMHCDGTRIGLKLGPYTVTAGIYIGEQLLCSRDSNR